MVWPRHINLHAYYQGLGPAHLLKQHVDMLCIPCNLGAFIGSVIEIQYIRFDAIIHWGLTSPVMLCTSACACAKSNVHAVLVMKDIIAMKDVIMATVLEGLIPKHQSTSVICTTLLIFTLLQAPTTTITMSPLVAVMTKSAASDN